MTETVAMIFGFTFVGIILICLAWTIMEYILGSITRPGKQNKKLMDNLDKMDKKMGM